MCKKIFTIAIILCFTFFATLCFAKGGGGGGGNGGGGGGNGGSGNNDSRNTDSYKNTPTPFIMKQSIPIKEKKTEKIKIIKKKKVIKAEKVIKRDSNIKGYFFKKLDDAAKELDEFQINGQEEAELIENSWGD